MDNKVSIQLSSLIDSGLKYVGYGTLGIALTSAVGSYAINIERQNLVSQRSSLSYVNSIEEYYYLRNKDESEFPEGVKQDILRELGEFELLEYQIDGAVTGILGGILLSVSSGAIGVSALGMRRSRRNEKWRK